MTILGVVGFTLRQKGIKAPLWGGVLLRGLYPHCRGLGFEAGRSENI
jgi:hypothetical protein